MAVLFWGNVSASEYFCAHLCEFRFLLYAVHGNDGVCTGFKLSGWDELEKQSVDERRHYFVCPFLLQCLWLYFELYFVVDSLMDSMD